MTQQDSLTDTILKTIDRIAEDYCPRTVREAAEQGEFPQALWNALDEIGLPRAWLAESAGGAELPVGEAMLALRRSAFHAMPVPLAETLIAGRLLVAAGIDLPDGPLTLATTGPSAGAQTPRLSKTASGWQLSGSARRVPWAGACAHAVLAASDGQQEYLVLVATAGAVRDAELNLAGEPRATLALDAVRVIAAEPMAEAAERMLCDGAQARSVQIAGALDAAMDIALRYTEERVQFGRPIGKFQAVQHMLAMLAGHMAAASAASNQAVEGGGERPVPFLVSIAKARAGEAAGRGAEIAHQALGAIGFTREHSLHNVTRRLWAWRDEFGNETYWQQRLGQDVAAIGADALWSTIVDL